MAQQSAIPTTVSDPMSDVAVDPGASFVVRQILESALANAAGPSPSPAWVPDAQALLANVLMNDYLNAWNGADADKNTLTKAQNAVNQARNSALAQHAQGLIYRAQGNHSGALTAFQQSSGAGFVRAQAQVGNQLVLSGGNTKQARTQIQKVIRQNPLHPASGYFYWAMGRAYFVDQDWRNAITWLTKSVDAAPNVSYNLAYMAAAKQHAGDTEGAKTTLQQFIDDPRFGNPQHGKQKVQQIVPPAAGNPNNDPVVTARQKFRDGLLAAMANLP